MEQLNISLKKKKKERIKIGNISEFKYELKKEGYKIDDSDEENFKEKIAETFKIDDRVIGKLYLDIKDNNITYKANDIKDFIDYMEKIMLFEDEHKRLCKEISKVKKLNIDRIEYERETSSQDNVENIINVIERVKKDVSTAISEKERLRLENLEKEIDRDYIYTKDIELLKKMVITREQGVRERYNIKTKTKTISIDIPKQIDYRYIKAKKGTVEYHQHLSNNIPRMKRLIRNINQYMEVDEKENTTFNINQSKTLQDSINIAIALYDNKEFKAISGSNDIKNYCIAPPLGKSNFKSNKVNKLGKLGVGYDRVNDSEKKIFEEIHKQIEEKSLKNEGELILYSKWEPCPSCYFVISQFRKKHPKIKVQVKYSKRYGE